MALLETWRKLAYETEMNQNQATEFWNSYFVQEKAIYEQILATPDAPVSGTVKELADKFGVEVLMMTGFLDGINDSLIRLKQWKKIRRSVLITIRKSFTITWLAARQTGYMSFLHGTIFFQKKKERHFTRSRSFQEQLSRQRKSEEMIHVLAAAAKSTRSAVERMRNSR